MKNCAYCESLFFAKQGNYRFCSKKCRRSFEYRQTQEQCKERSRNYWRKNREERLRKQKAYYEKNKKDILLKQREYEKTHPEIRRKNAANYRNKNREKVRARIAEWVKANPERRKEIVKKSKRKAIDELSESYVASLLGAPKGGVPPELIELKKKQLSLHRLITETKTKT